MKTHTVIAIALVCALALPVAAAHIIFAHPDGAGGCTTTLIGNPNSEPHAGVWISPCGPVSHGFLP